MLSSWREDGILLSSGRWRSTCGSLLCSYPVKRRRAVRCVELGKQSSCWGSAFPHTGSILPLLGPTSAEPGPGPASEHPGCSSGPGLLGRGWDTQVQLDLEHVTACVNALGWTLETQEPRVTFGCHHAGAVLACVGCP